MLLADLGADVVRVDRPGNVPVIPPETDITSRGKRSVIVDLKHERGASVVLDLASRADVLLEGLRPGVTERLGIGPDECWARNPPLVYGRMTGWGQDGPLPQAAGHDIGYIAVTGALHAIGRAGGPPQVPVNYLGDFGGGSMFLVLGVMAALWESRVGGRGQVVDAAIVDGTAALQAMTYSMLASNLWRDERGVNFLDSGAPYYDVYETADGRHMAVGAIEPKFYAEFIRLLFGDAPPAGLGPGCGRRGGASRSEIAKGFLSRTQAEWAAVFEGTDACVAPVVSLTEAPGHPHLAARATYVEADGIIQPGVAPRFSRTPGAAGAIELPGAHSREVLADWGVADAAALLAAGVVRERPLAWSGASQPAPLRRGTGWACRAAATSGCTCSSRSPASPCPRPNRKPAGPCPTSRAHARTGVHARTGTHGRAGVHGRARGRARALGHGARLHRHLSVRGRLVDDVREHLRDVVGDLRGRQAGRLRHLLKRGRVHGLLELLAGDGKVVTHPDP